MNNLTRRGLALAGLALLASASAGYTQQPQPVRVRGTVEAVDGAMLTVKSRDGKTTYKVKLADNVAVRGIIKATLADIKANSFIGVTGMPQADGSQKALEVHIFAESQRGAGEGHRPWSGAPNSTMTNGTVGQTVTGIDGPVITVKYKDGEKKIVVGPGVPIVRYEIGSTGELKPGAAFTVVAATKQPDGSFTASRINVGRDDVVPQ